MDERRDLGERGLGAAMERLGSCVAGDGTAFDIPFTECLFWVYSLHQLHEANYESPMAFRLFNAETQEGQTFRAIEWARTFAAHDLLQLGQPNYTTSGIRGIGVRGMSMRGAGPGPPIWAGEANLQSHHAPEDDRRSLYEKLVAGRPVLLPLETVAAYLSSLPESAHG